ncbi:hypothetical protein [Nostoc sp. FACHB-110]|uniref:hypothetical protein n=1 Tax=Nostoc sp. FACHB-110 TaxID=2692834 RepID=UPI00168424C1|nr:hypothetical protein [Nostoc sp. FACHB-110]MBD2440974.1 hypothetical protein [Nostoc sp. FACHB-110]MBD2441015.1 hypothetical protein [Nostoc sp. FACHB-110]
MGRASKRKAIGSKSINKQHRRIPTAQMLNEWLFSHQVSQWIQTYIEIPEDFSHLLRQRLIQTQLEDMNSDSRVRWLNHLVIGINALNWELWLSTPLTMTDYQLNVFGEPVKSESIQLSKKFSQHLRFHQP